jgi:hypothetical protein
MSFPVALTPSTRNWRNSLSPFQFKLKLAFALLYGPTRMNFVISTTIYVWTRTLTGTCLSLISYESLTEKLESSLLKGSSYYIVMMSCSPVPRLCPPLCADLTRTISPILLFLKATVLAQIPMLPSPRRSWNIWWLLL